MIRRRECLMNLPNYLRLLGKNIVLLSDVRCVPGYDVVNVRYSLPSINFLVDRGSRVIIPVTGSIVSEGGQLLVSSLRGMCAAPVSVMQAEGGADDLTHNTIQGEVVILTATDHIAITDCITRYYMLTLINDNYATN